MSKSLAQGRAAAPRLAPGGWVGGGLLRAHLRWLLGFVLLLSLLAQALQPVHAAPPAGAAIDSRAEASYVPAGRVLPELVYSNTIRLVVAPVESLSLIPDAVLNRPVGTQAVLAHLLTNNGNTPADIRFDLANRSGDDYDLTSLKLVRDLNGNGVVDPGEPLLPSDGTPSGIRLAPGEALSVLVVGMVPLTAGANGPARALLELGASTSSASPVRVSVLDTIRTGRLAAVALLKTADPSGSLQPGTDIRYRITATSIGERPATASATSGNLAATTILIDGVASPVLLLRDALPAASSFVPGSLSTSLPGAMRLYRLPGDAAYAYRSNGDDASAIEVAVASRSASLAPGVTTEMSFTARVRDEAMGQRILNSAELAFGDGSGPSSAVSNPVLHSVAQQRIGLATRALPAVYEQDASGRLLGTARVRLIFTLENFGSLPARNVQIHDVLAGAQVFGRYTAASNPAAGEYTVLANSVRVQALRQGAALAFDTHYTGEGARTGLLTAGSSLPPYGAVEVAVDVRVHAQGRDGVIFNRAHAQAELANTAGTVLRDDSVDGSVPDANGDGDPSNDASPTRIVLSMPSLMVEQSVVGWRRVQAPTNASPNDPAIGAVRRYDIDYRIALTNNGSATATHIQLEGNLACTFRARSARAAVSAWALHERPRVAHGLLGVNLNYTGSAPCTKPPSRDGQAAASLTKNMAAALTNGQHHLEPGQSEVITFTVRMELNPLAAASERVFDNIVIASIGDRADPTTFIARVTTMAAAEVMPLDPSGVVYHASTRLPVPGAVVALQRVSCPAAPTLPITATQIAPFPGVSYRFAADGTVSLTTGADGRYVFLLNHPPVHDACEYRIKVLPPGDSLRFPSTSLPAQAGAAPGGAVQA